jgi:hypothetical protein
MDRQTIHVAGHQAIDATLAELRKEWKDAIPCRMN